MPGPLASHIDAFVDAVGTELTDLAAIGGAAARDFRAEAVDEASNLVAAVCDSDGRWTLAELDAWLDGLGWRLTSPVRVDAVALRESGLLAGKAAWLGQPSTIARLLLDADRANGTRRAEVYYAVAMRLAHAAAAVDLVPSTAEITAIDRFRGVLLGAFDAAGVPRPGSSHRPVGAPATQAPAAPASATPATTPPRVETRSLDELLAELDELVGLDSVKADVRRLTSLLRIQKLRAERQLPTMETSHHLVFTGNPGTGKTTVARLLSQILHALDLVSIGHLIETDRSHLVAGFVGQTATRTRDVLDSARGGTLIIDEAYALARGGSNDFGREAIDTLVKYMEDHRADLAVIAAGYPAEMAEFIATNPGLQSRFTRTLHFPDYSTDELVEIFELMGGKLRYHLDADARATLHTVIDLEPRDRGFGNARFVRNLFEAAIGRQAVRLANVESPTDEQLTTLLATDVTSS